MIRLVRSLIGLALLAAVVWCSFHIPLGRRTFAEHADRIGQTDEAKELLDSTRHTITPVFRDATERMLGEHIEAPTTAVPTRATVREQIEAAAKAVPVRTTARSEHRPGRP